MIKYYWISLTEYEGQSNLKQRGKTMQLYLLPEIFMGNFLLEKIS